MKLTIACVQINLRRASIDANRQRILQLLAACPRVPDLVVLPELAVTGYHYRSRELITPYLDDYAADKLRDEQLLPLQGKLLSLAQEISLKYQCFTLMGYPEKLNQHIYNLAALVAPNGRLLHNYRKLFLYDADYEFGCEENPDRGFRAVDIIFDKEFYLNRNPDKFYPSTRTNIGICMDLNPYKFTAPFTAWEFANACYQQQSTLILCLMAWLLPKSPLIVPNISDDDKLAQGHQLERRYFGNDVVSKDHINTDTDHLAMVVDTTANDEADEQLFIPQQPNVLTLNYWVLRFFPFLTFGRRQGAHYFDRATVVCCNRVGVEDDVMYTGTSLIFQFGPLPIELIHHDYRNPLVQLRGCMGQGEEGVLLREVAL